MGRMMDGLYFSAPLADGRTLCLSQMTDRRAAMATHAIEDTSGYFLYELTGTGERASVEVIARLVDEESVLRLRTMLALR